MFHVLQQWTVLERQKKWFKNGSLVGILQQTQPNYVNEAAGLKKYIIFNQMKSLGAFILDFKTLI